LTRDERGVLVAGVLLGAWAAGAGCSSSPPCPSPPRPLAVDTAPAPGADLLTGVAAKSRAAGAGELVVLASSIGAEGDRAGGFLRLPKDRCVLVFARGSRGVGDVDLFAFQDDGGTVAADESSADQAALLLCPPLPDRVYVSARIASGSGLVAVGVQDVAPEKATLAARAVGARAAGEESGRLESWPGLEAKIVAHRRAIGSSWEDIRRFAAPVDARAPTRTTVTIEAGRCIDVLLVPSEEVASLEVVAEAEDGRIVARAQAEGRDRSMLLCSEFGESVTVSARPRGSSGMVAFVVARSPVGGASEVSRSARIDRVSQSLSVEGARAALAKELDPSWGKSKGVGSGQAKVGSRSNVPLKLAAGCSRVDVVAGSPLGPLSAALWDPEGKLVSEVTGSLRATLLSCGAARDARLDVESRGRPGPFVVDVRTWADAGSELVRHPFAAARLFDRIVGPTDLAPDSLAGAKPIDLAAGKLHASSFVVAPASCTEVIAALDATGGGLEVRLVDAATNEDFIGRGRFVASQRVCAGPSARKVALELRVDDGPARALVLVRPLQQARAEP
jgi:hypothetical protein